MMSLVSQRKRLALPKTSWQMCLLALIAGTLSALLVVLFTLSVEALHEIYLPQNGHYNSIDKFSRLIIPFIGVFFILCIAWFTGYQYLRAGIPFVLHRLKVSHGFIPFKNTLNQFFGGVLSLSAGFSVGREGPAVHLGAACSSYISQKLKLPYNSMRTLCACGIAAGISACFNTPLAAVIFVLEVILKEYKVHIFIPIMTASIVGAMLTQYLLGTEQHFSHLKTISLTYHHYPALVILGLSLGFLGFIFNRYLVKIVSYSSKYHIVPRLFLAALITGVLGFFVPYAMGTDVSAISFSLSYTWHIDLLLGLLIAKFIMTISALGLGIPGGIIGPILGIGAIAGALGSAMLMQYYPDVNLGNDFILMGMAGFMAATLNAPLAALLAIVELSHQLNIMLPAMIVITSACLASRQFFNNRSIFYLQLEAQKLIYYRPPVEKSLEIVGVLTIMQENILVVSHDTELSSVDLPKENPPYLIVKSPPPTTEYFWKEAVTSNLDNTEVKNHYVTHKLSPLSSQTTLAEAYKLLAEDRRGGVYIYQENTNEIIGIVMFSQIKDYLLEGKLTP